MKRKFFTIFLSLFLLLGLNTPSFAGSGSDGFIEVTWKNIKKSKAKNCYPQKINFKILENVNWAPNSYYFIEYSLYNSEDEIISSGIESWGGRNNSSNSIRFCKSTGKGPYYLEIKWHTNWFDPDKEGFFTATYKFKK